MTKKVNIRRAATAASVLHKIHLKYWFQPVSLSNNNQLKEEIESLSVNQCQIQAQYKIVMHAVLLVRVLMASLQYCSITNHKVVSENVKVKKK